MDKHMRKGPKVSRRSCWKHSQQYFTLLDFRDSPKKSQQANPLWKVQSLLNKLNKQASCIWLPGKFLAVTEQMIGYQGSLGLKIRISYKRKGNGFQWNAICNCGYTFSFWFQCIKPPNILSTYKHHDVSPTDSRLCGLPPNSKSVDKNLHG